MVNRKDGKMDMRYIDNNDDVESSDSDEIEFKKKTYAEDRW